MLSEGLYSLCILLNSSLLNYSALLETPIKATKILQSMHFKKALGGFFLLLLCLGCFGFQKELKILL